MKRIFVFLLCLMLAAALAGCGGRDAVEPQVANLAKLGKVWGFAKYTHPTFLTGQMCWDAELLNLIPIVMADEADINGLLYDWFVSLGDDGYGDHGIITIKAQVDSRRGHLLNEIPWLSLMSLTFADETTTFLAQMAKENLPDWEALAKEPMWSLSNLEFEIIDENAVNFQQMADLSWISRSNLGRPLFERLSRFEAIRPLDRANAPIYFNYMGNKRFTNEQAHEDMDFGNVSYRLLGLFRMWNVIEYYFPFRNILDEDWHKLLIEFIPKMMEGDCRHSYESTLSLLSRHLHDAHVTLGNTNHFFVEFGNFPLPANLVEAEGRLVVYEPILHNQQLLRGDVILALNGVDIDDITANMLQFISYPTYDRALARLAPSALWSHTEEMTVRVLRGDIELEFEMVFDFNYWTRPSAPPSHIRLENNIGLINPGHFSRPGEIHRVMSYFSDTDGLIIDLRQYPNDYIVFSLAEYLIQYSQAFAVELSAAVSVPGMYVESIPIYAGGAQSLGAYFYENPVVVLISETTISLGEITVLPLINAPNVTIMGRNSIGAVGSVNGLPLPGGITLVFTGHGIAPPGVCVQRIGIIPDIRVERTIQGVAEGRDEIMEAAIDFLLE